ncbi:MAG: D-2-hydroxyacid dehydrogenase [Clostridia bacterium]|nr:D-2-hydroxyacid dehydrogenase [Clostridia bacterium]
MKIILTETDTVSNHDIDLSVFKELGEVTAYGLTRPEEVVPRLQEADAVLINKVVLDRKVLQQLPQLKYIGLFATGYNNVDIACAAEQGITVCNAGSYSTDAVAQHVFAFLLHHASQVHAYDAFVAEGGWIRSRVFTPFDFPTSELSGKVLGIIGYGSIGQRVAEIARAFGMRVCVYSRTPKDDPSVEFISLEALLGLSDYITVHCPLNKQTERMFNAERFAQCKPGAYFINTARGGIVDNAALRAALESGRLSGAALDVLDREPMAKDCILLGTPNLTITPHTAWAPLETRQRLTDIVYQNLASYLAGNPVNVVV